MLEQPVQSAVVLARICAIDCTCIRYNQMGLVNSRTKRLTLVWEEVSEYIFRFTGITPTITTHESGDVCLHATQELGESSADRRASLLRDENIRDANTLRVAAEGISWILREIK